MRALVPMSLSLLLVASGAGFAADTAAPLPAGKPAGVKTAQETRSNTILLALGIGAVAAGIALVASDSDSAPTAVSTATGTSP